MSAQFPKGWRGTGLYSVCSPNTNDYFAIEADTMIDNVRVT